MTVHAQHVTTLEACLGKAARLETLIGYASDSVVSKTLLDKQVGTVTLFAFDKGQKLSEHTSPYDAIVLVTEGHATVTIGGQPRDVSSPLRMAPKYTYLSPFRRSRRGRGKESRSVSSKRHLLWMTSPSAPLYEIPSISLNLEELSLLAMWPINSRNVRSPSPRTT